MDTTALDPRARPQEPAGAAGGDEGGSSSILDRTIDVSAVGWVAVGWVVVAAVAVALRLARLDVWAMAPEEARRAYQAYSLYLGRPLDPGESLPTTAPLFLLLQSFGFFLFGATDAVARIMPALLGLALVPLAWLLRPFVGKYAALGMGALVALSPTLVYGARQGTPAILVAAALGVVVAVLRIGLPAGSDGTVRRRSAVAGIALGLLYASGPIALTVLVALAVGVAAAAVGGRTADGARDDALARSGRAIARVPGTLASGAAGLMATLLVLFTRLFSDIGAIAGLGETLADWARLVASDPGTAPTQYFILAILLYEPLALAFAFVAGRWDGGAAGRRDGETEAVGRLGPAFFVGWFVAALLLISLGSGRAPEHQIQVALPLVLLGGLGLGQLVGAIAWRSVFRGPSGLLALVYLGLVIGLSAFGILAGRIDEAASSGAALSQALFVLFLVVLPLGYAAWVLIGNERATGNAAQAGRMALIVVALILGAFTLRSAILLNFYNAGEGSEPIAQRTVTGSVRPMVDRLMRLSRDTTLNRASVRDTTGGRSLVIALDERVEWPFRWYFRDFPDLDVVAPGTAPAAGAEVVIAPDETGMPEAGYTPRTYPYLNRVPAAYSEPDVGDILATIFNPSRWLDGVRYLLYRDLDNPAVAETVAVGLNGELTARVAPSSGPFNLFDRAGAGAGRGQFSQPRGIAVDQGSGVTYVVDMGNLRVERFGPEGEFIGIWGGGEEGGVTFGSATGLGPTGIAVGADGLVYVADTWNHRVVGLDESGSVVREIGSGELVDLQNDPARVSESPGFFFGPRAVLVHNDEIYVVDTGNERVQVFGLDGTFRRTWGGYGSEPGQLREPVGIAVGPDGLIYVADSDNARISVFTPEGSPVRQFPVQAWTGGSYIEPYLTFGQDGRLYATSQVTGSVEVFDPNGTPLDSIREVDGQGLQQPIGIGTDADGAILITDAGRSAVYRYVPPTVAEEAPPPVEDDGAASPAGPLGDGSGGGTPVVTGTDGGSNQVPLAVPTNQAPPGSVDG